MRISLLDIYIGCYFKREIIYINGYLKEKLKRVFPEIFYISILRIKKANIKIPCEYIEKSLFAIGWSYGKFHIDLFWFLNDLIIKYQIKKK